MFFGCILEQNRNYAKAASCLAVILLSDQDLDWPKVLNSLAATGVEGFAPAGVCFVTPQLATPLEIAVPKALILKLTLAAAVIAAATCFGIPVALAFRDAPWCAVIDYGDGGVTWECSYRTFEECYPNVIAGNKGSCNVNPAGQGPSTFPRAANPKHRKHSAQH
jgi:hypothetical protein